MDSTDQPRPPVRAGLLTQIFSEWRTLAILGGPILIAQLAQMANGVIDTIMAGHASAEDLAGVGIGTSLWVPVLLLFIGVLSAQQPIVSGYCGAGQQQRVVPTAWQGLYLGVVASVLMILLLSNAGPLLDVLGLDAVTADIARGYLQAFAWGIPALILINALRGLTDGLGFTQVIMAFSLLSTAFNLPLNYVFIYGKLGLPEFGGVGCGWATSISNGIAALALWTYLHFAPRFARYRLWSGRVAPDWGVLRRVLRLGLPIGFTMFVEVSMFSVIALFLAPLGPVVVAGHQIVLNVISVLFMAPLSLGMAVTLRVSFLLGAELPQSARLLARSSLLLALGIALFYVPLVLWSSQGIVRLYTGDLQVQAVALQLLWFAAVFQVADVLQVTAIHALRGYRDTRIPMLIMLLAFWGVCLPVGYVLTFTHWLVEPMGAPGFWIALIIGLALASVLLTWRLWSISRKVESIEHTSAR